MKLGAFSWKLQRLAVKIGEAVSKTRFQNELIKKRGAYYEATRDALNFYYYYYDFAERRNKKYYYSYIVQCTRVTRNGKIST